jgi:hypothetical protein
LKAATAHASSWYATNPIMMMHVTDSILQLIPPRKETSQLQDSWFPFLKCTVHRDHQKHFHSIHVCKYTLCLSISNV